VGVNGAGEVGRSDPEPTALFLPPRPRILVPRSAPRSGPAPRPACCRVLLIPASWRMGALVRSFEPDGPVGGVKLLGEPALLFVKCEPLGPEGGPAVSGDDGLELGLMLEV
jgi:hypothetical protein